MKISSVVLSLLATAGLVSATLGDTNKVLPQIPGMWRNAPGKNTTQSEDDTQTEQSTRAIGGITSLPRRWIESLQARQAEVVVKVVTEAD
ncbi:unnamed protein product [Clonostachys rosea f. rosea IK726]|uniref:Uncharacterized protein n=2 Tax=Bionectria ochroleuca TaxID=29856 RepID=A0A0B7KKT1_BIOOC|nr:unnamed protein product [Clonostachys rosea f. rosea IK726]